MKFSWLKLLIITFLFFLCGFILYVFQIYSSVQETVQKIYVPLQREVPSLKQEQQQSIERSAPVSVLLLGIDQREKDRGRSDTIMLLAANPNSNSLVMVNIPRDTYTKIMDHGTEDKINHSYAFGGIDMAVKTVENFTDIPVDYYISVNMEGFTQIIDMLGGIDVHNPQPFQFEEHSFAQGDLHLNGERALAYARMRYDDPKGDLGRNDRQQQIVVALLEKVSKIETFYKYEDILGYIAKDVKTNLTFEEMKHLVQNYRQSIDHIEKQSIAGKGTIKNGVYYYMVDDEERKRINHILTAQLELLQEKTYSRSDLINISKDCNPLME